MGRRTAKSAIGMTGYESPLSTRYSCAEMSALFSAEGRARVWRELWVALAKAERQLGLNITAHQIKELELSVHTIDLSRIAALESETRHDVMAHILAYGEQCPESRPIIHLGATSAYVTDNGDLILMREALKQLRAKLVQLVRQLACFASDTCALPCLAYTHLQPAQPTTVGKRASLWLQDWATDLQTLERFLKELPFLGAKGATGTQASFLQLFDGDAEKVSALDRLVASFAGFERLLPISGQTYSRKIDYELLCLLSGVAVTAHKMATDLRLLASMGEIEEPFGRSQVGSSAMPHKRNPIYSERVCALSRYLMQLPSNAAQTAASQWMERTLDDSANRRIVLPEGFLAADSILNLSIHISTHLVVYPKVIARRLKEELPFLAAERILMQAVKAGGDRQELHEALRVHCVEARQAMREEGIENPLFSRLGNDPRFVLSKDELRLLKDPIQYTGLASEQTKSYLENEISPLLAHFQTLAPTNYEPKF